MRHRYRDSNPGFRTENPIHGMLSGTGICPEILICSGFASRRDAGYPPVAVRPLERP
jgi:hypothetical protein